MNQSYQCAKCAIVFDVSKVVKWNDPKPFSFGRGQTGCRSLFFCSKSCKEIYLLKEELAKWKIVALLSHYFI